MPVAVLAQASNLFQDGLRVLEVLARLYEPRTHALRAQGGRVVHLVGNVCAAGEKITLRVRMLRVRVAGTRDIGHQGNFVEAAFEGELHWLAPEEGVQGTLALPAKRVLSLRLGGQALQLAGAFPVQRLLDGLAHGVDG